MRLSIIRLSTKSFMVNVLEASRRPFWIHSCRRLRFSGVKIRRLGLLKPRLGRVRRSGVCPPSKPSRSLLPARDFWPLCPRPDVLPLPEPRPRPLRTLSHLAPLLSRRLLSAMMPSSGIFVPCLTRVPLVPSRRGPTPRYPRAPRGAGERPAPAAPAADRVGRAELAVAVQTEPPVAVVPHRSRTRGGRGRWRRWRGSRWFFTLIDAPLPCRRGGRHAADDARRAPRTAAAAVVTESAM
mmetsp:Transcript_1607/g.3643  ORF Transcript_1607/g.3643 Transcript_1607/m.3643 type:complete len:239 (+) Transcript_1607:608-1324(+)